MHQWYHVTYMCGKKHQIPWLKYMKIPINYVTMWPCFQKNPTPNKNREPINKPKDYEIRVTPQKTNMTMENQPWMKMYLLLKMVIFQCHVSLQGVYKDFMFPSFCSHGIGRSKKSPPRMELPLQQFPPVHRSHSKQNWIQQQKLRHTVDAWNPKQPPGIVLKP